MNRQQSFHQLLEESGPGEATFRLLFHNHPIPMWIFDRNTLAFLEVNEAALELYGYSREEFFGMTLTDIHPVEEYDRLTSRAADKHNGHGYCGEWQHCLRGGRVIDVEINGRMLEYNGSDATLETARDITERKQAEAKLLASEARYRRLFESAKDGILILDAGTGRIEDVNPYLMEMLGYSHTRFIGKQLWEIGLFKDIDANREAFEKLQDQKFIRYENLPLETSDGRPIWVEFVSNVYDVNGMQVIQCNIRNITERKRAEEALRASRQITEGIINAIPLGIFWKDTNLTYQGCNAVFAHDAGFADPGDVVGKDDFQMGWSGHAELFRSDDRRVIESGSPRLHVEEPQTASDGHPIVLLSSKIPLRNAKGDVNGILGTYLDITDYRSAQEHLRQSEEQLRSILESVRDAVFTVSPFGILTSVSPAFQRITGWLPVDWIGRSFTDLMHADDIFLVRDIFTRILSGEASAEFEGRIKTSDGNFIVTDFLISPQQRNNKIIGVLGIGRDISERRRAEEKKKILEAQLLQAQKLESLGTLASGIAHDFNNILGIIIGHASSLDGLIPDRATIQKNVAAILKAGIRGAAVVKQMLTFARKTETLIEPVAINEIVTEVAKLLRGTFAKTISVVLAPEPSIPLINADANQIHQVMLNLCVNARDAMPDGGTLTLTTHQEAGAAVRGAPPEAAGTDYVVLSVTDTGIGMDEETQQRVFEPFFTTKERDKGTGLGLSLVFGIMESHGGFVTLQSVPGEGSTFNCCFPVLHDVSDQASRTTAKTEGVPGGGETILVVEDEGTLRELIRAFLSAKGYTVLTANNGEEAFSIFTQRQNEIHLVLSDLGLPKFGGDELFRKITKTNPRIPTILASGYIEPGMKVRMLEEGVREFIQKPYNPNEVLVAIRRVLDGEPPSARPGKNHV